MATARAGRVVDFLTLQSAGGTPRWPTLPARWHVLLLRRHKPCGEPPRHRRSRHFPLPPSQPPSPRWWLQVDLRHEVASVLQQSRNHQPYAPLLRRQPRKQPRQLRTAPEIYLLGCSHRYAHRGPDRARCHRRLTLRRRQILGLRRNPTYKFRATHRRPL